MDAFDKAVGWSLFTMVAALIIGLFVSGIYSTIARQQCIKDNVHRDALSVYLICGKP